MPGTTKVTGDASEAAVLAALVGAGLAVLLPWGDNQPYDLVVHAPVGFVRVQVKTGRVRGGVIRANGTSQNTYVRRRYTAAEVDVIAIYATALGTVYMVPIDKCVYNITLRLERARNGQEAGVRWARDFQLDRWIATITGRPVAQSG